MTVLIPKSPEAHACNTPAGHMCCDQFRDLLRFNPIASHLYLRPGDKPSRHTFLLLVFRPSYESQGVGNGAMNPMNLKRNDLNQIYFLLHSL